MQKWQLFGRFDQLASNTISGSDHPWAREIDGSAVVGGVEYSPISRVKLALNYQGWYPYASDMNDKPYVFLNLEFKL